MELSNEAEKQLNERLQKCRCCFRMLIDDRRAVIITVELRSQFADLTGIEVNKTKSLLFILLNYRLFQLLVSEIFADRICQLCASDLKVFSNLREDLIVKQKALYTLAGLDDALFSAGKTCELQDEDTDMVQEVRRNICLINDRKVY